MYAKEKEKIAFLKKVYQDKELLPEIQQRLFKDEIHIKKIVQYVDSLINTANVENVNLKHLNFVVRMHANEINSLLRLKQKQLKKNTYTDKPIPHKRKIRHLKEFQEDYQSINPFSSLITTIKQLKQKQN